jgi:hypothetical protein
VSTPFVTSLRARPETLVVGNPGADAITIRAQLFEAWDAVRISASPNESVENVKARALETLDPSGGDHAGYLVKLRGFEILDETISLAAAGVANGSTMLIAFRHRRPVR